MVVSLYTSRVIFNLLGVQDFGIYSLVAGFVTIVGFLNSSMSAASQRFLAYEIGKNESDKVNEVFSMCINIHVLISILILILAETFGLWFVNNKLTIPTERISAANWTYQLAILTFIITVVGVPYNALIIAKEKMQAFAWISIIDVSLKLGLVLSLTYLSFDKLKLYSLLMFLAGLAIFLIYKAFCRYHFKEVKYVFFWNRNMFKKMLSFTSWNFISDAGYAFYAQGLNILLGIFFGPVLNAAAGIAYQVMGAVNGFVRNFQVAVNPQIIKSISGNASDYELNELVCRGAKFSFFLLTFFVMPFLIEGEYILQLWLGELPYKAVIFTKLVLIIILIESFSGTLTASAQGVGNIKLYQAISGLLMLLIVPVSYVFLLLKFSAEFVYVVGSIISFVCLLARMIVLNRLMNFYFKKFVTEVLLVSFLTFIVAYIFSAASLHFSSFENLHQFGFIVISLLFSALSIYVIGLKKAERIAIHKLIFRKLFR